MPTAHCVREPDGYHAHLYAVYIDGNAVPATIELSLHAWMDEHRRTHPNARDVYAYRRLGLAGIEALGKFDTVDEAWKALDVGGNIPPVACASASPDSSSEEG
ncbi:hypothetical protein DMB42_11710 [Nonomuraea sp. WAC 01424]|uniref:hypothetical protein n=1 Tax=Nonomuraea sp. WAC 01424 TaxID=2203200 RepID=UPI000F7AD499|nr:hypothetical protein [Nonomuraea sp. WAC 01424]RSN12837.1 hypothetical protein DMB42_11710 [Nonomuraea sp. WAC 01424]